MPLLSIKNLQVEVDQKAIIRGLDLTVHAGEIHAIMGPNGSGKSTLANVLMGHPRYKVVSGKINYKGKNLSKLLPQERSLAGVFLAFQYPKEIAGVNLIEFLRTAYNCHSPQQKTSVFGFKKILDQEMELLEIDKKFANRFINNGFSGGEKKKSEMLQMAILKPTLAVLDETDSGLDIDALKIVCESIKRLMRPDMAVIVITHYPRILEYITPSWVHIMVDGRIVKSGNASFAKEVEKRGYQEFKKKV